MFCLVFLFGTWRPLDFDKFTQIGRNRCIYVICTLRETRIDLRKHAISWFGQMIKYISSISWRIARVTLVQSLEHDYFEKNTQSFNWQHAGRDRCSLDKVTNQSDSCYVSALTLFICRFFSFFLCVFLFLCLCLCLCVVHPVKKTTFSRRIQQLMFYTRIAAYTCTGVSERRDPVADIV